jgi:CHAD domain-containing protein
VAGHSLRRALQRYLRHQVDEVRRLTDPAYDDPEQVHDLRVALRRAHSVLAAGDLRDLVRDTIRALGAPRDIEVVGGILMPRVTDPADHALVRSILDGRHDRASAVASSARLAEVLHELDRAVSASAPAVRERSFRKEVRRVRRLAGEADHHTGDTRWTALHDVRKAAKRARYVAEATPDAGTGPLVKALKQLQDVLGDQHDLVVAASALRELGAAEPTGGLVRLAGELEDEAEALDPAYRSALEAVLERA